MAIQRQGRNSQEPELNRRDSYWSRSKCPLEILVFLAPFIVAYEIGLLGVLQSGEGTVLTNLAHKTIIDLFQSLGVTAAGLALPGVVLVIILLVWQVLRRTPWRIDGKTIGLMWVESALLVLPLLLLAQLLTGVHQFSQSSPGPPEVNPGLLASLAVGIGAGLYEELIFRWLLIAVIHTIACDLFKASHRVGLTIAVVISALAFMFYHPIDGAPMGRMVFYFLGGIYFGTLFVARGFGIVAATHAMYDIVVVLGDR
jgi:membrane protease YdiL (CAAX protease family)